MADAPKRRRVSVSMSETDIAAIDVLVGKRGRGRFISEAVAGELWRRRMQAALAEMEGALADVDIPGWETPEAAAEWVRALRRGDPVGVLVTPDEEAL